MVVDQNPLGFGTGALLKVSGLRHLGVAKEERERLREREMRLFFLGEINHSSERAFFFFFLIKQRELLLIRNLDDNEDFSGFCH